MTLEQYNSLSSIDADALYFITDSKMLIMGGKQYSHRESGEKPLLKNPYIHPVYDYVACLDQENKMELSGYFATEIKRMELWITAEEAGNICISVNGQSFNVPVKTLPSQITLNFTEPLTGRISITRDVENPNDTLDGKTVYVVDWKIFQGE